MRIIQPLYFLLLVTFSTSLFSQTSKDTIIAKSGDGIFSILRNAGIHPIKYYEDFLNLNDKFIRNGSDLIVGERYILPNAPDSFRNMGTRIMVDTGMEQPIFRAELSKMRIKDSTLSHTVYYLMNSPETLISNSSNDFMLALAKQLMVRGARVCFLQKDIERVEQNNEEERIAHHKSILGEYSSVINKKFLAYNGSYQRVLVIEDDISNTRNFDVNLRYYGNSGEDARLAESLKGIFLKNAIKKTNSSIGASLMRGEANIYLAKNVLPVVTIIGLHHEADKKDPGIQLRSNRTVLTKMIVSGILKDYSSLDIENK